MLLRLSGLDAQEYLKATAVERDHRLYVPESLPQYRLALSQLLPDVPVVGDDADQAGLGNIFDQLSILQGQGPAAANNLIVGWNVEPRVVRLQFAETHNSDVDDCILKIRDRDDVATRHYYTGGILLGSMIFTAPPAKLTSDTLVTLFNVVVRTSDDYYTVAVSSYYDRTSEAWHLREVVRCVSPRPAVANPMAF